MARLMILLVGAIFCANLSAQDLNVTLRSKITFTSQTLANVCGYTSRDNKEYALIGASKGMYIVDVTDPDNPQQIVQIPGQDNLWKEIKTYSHYAYVVTEGGTGIQVVNMKSLPSPDLPYHYYNGDGVIAGQLTRIHALHIDVKKGFLYAWGGNLFSGGAKVFDLKQDPYNPVYVGNYTQLGYIHDGYVENDTMYSGHIYNGAFAIVNMANKSAPELINTQPTPGAFTHNVWLTDDHRTLLTTDEVSGGVLASFDVSDPTDIKALDQIQSNPGSGVIVHNTHIRQNWAVTSWYKDGFTIVDATRPDNLIQVGNYDTYPTTGTGFEGCWGVYPFFPSGTIIASNINVYGSANSELLILTPQYKRACYLEGHVTNALNGNPINTAKIEILGSNPFTQDVSNSNGVYKTGQAEAGYFKVRISKNGYQPYEGIILLTPGEVTALDVALFPVGNLTVTGNVVAAIDNQPVDGAVVWLFGPGTPVSATTDPFGDFTITGVNPGIYEVTASAPGVGNGGLPAQLISGDTNFNIKLTDVVRKDAESKNEASLETLENPFANTCTLQYSNPAGTGKITLWNNQGQLVQEFPANGVKGAIQVGAALPAGVYFAKFESEGTLLKTEKLLKTR